MQSGLIWLIAVFLPIATETWMLIPENWSVSYPVWSFLTAALSGVVFLRLEPKLWVKHCRQTSHWKNWSMLQALIDSNWMHCRHSVGRGCLAYLKVTIIDDKKILQIGHRKVLIYPSNLIATVVLLTRTNKFSPKKFRFSVWHWCHDTNCSSEENSLHEKSLTWDLLSLWVVSTVLFFLAVCIVTSLAKWLLSVSNLCTPYGETN